MSKSKRLLSLDILRGITVSGMILVNNGYDESFEMLQHAKWNGMTPCDLVFPFFLFIMGVSTYLSLSKFDFRMTPEAMRKIVRRTLLLFLIGLGINWLDHAVWGDVMCFGHLRLFAVLQRIALCYGIVSVLALTIPHKSVVPLIVALLAVYSAVLLLGNGYAEDSTNILAQVDLRLFGEEHLYHKSPVDPEGLLGTISSVAQVLIGFYCGMRIKKSKSVPDKVTALFVIGTVLVIGGYLLSYGLPLNKRIWSPSYVMVTCGLASSLLALLMYFIDIRNQRGWCTFFHVFGINPIFLYVSSEVLAILFGRFGINDMLYHGIAAVVAYPKIASLCYAVAFVLLNYALGYLLFRRKIFIKL